ncbi:MAG: lipopolysaccharide biosynthesis protein [Thermoanaerobaculia bacterium]
MIYAVANVASAAVPFAFLPVLTRVLDPEAYGRVIGFALMVTLCGAVAGLNVHGALGVLWFKRRPDEVAVITGTALALAAGSLVVLAPFAAFGVTLFPGISGGIEPVWGGLAVVAAGSSVILHCRTALWQSQGRAWRVAFLQFAGSALNVGLSLVGVVLLGLGAEGRNGGIAASAVLISGVAVGLLIAGGEVRWAPRREDVKTLLSFGVPLSAHILAGAMLGTADRWIVSVRLGPGSLGLYGAGAQLGMALAMLGDAFVKAYAPWLYARLSSGQPEDKDKAIAAIGLTLPAFLVLGGLVWAGLWLVSGAVLGPQYRSAVSVLPWFMLGGAFSAAYASVSVLFFYWARTGLLAATSCASAAIGVSITWLLVGQFGATGAAMGFAATQAVLALCATFVASRVMPLPWSHPVRAVRIWGRSIRHEWSGTRSA